jgi:eukaryotic-like serine/threonine-protein kinase
MGIAHTLRAVATRLSSAAAPAASVTPLESMLRRKKTASPAPVNHELSGIVARGAYHIQAPVGTGATGLIYSAWQAPLERRVAIKVLRPQFANDNAMRERLLHEAHMAATVRNEHVIEVLDCGTLENDQTFMVMEYVEGQRLSDLLDQEGALDLHIAVAIALQLAEALDSTHKAGIFHADIKPDNVLLCERPGNPYFVKLVDFGVAGTIDPAPSSQRHGMVCGTPSYMSPEQVVGACLDGRCDIYSLGVVLYEMLSGITPIRGSHPRELLGRQRTMAPVPLRSQARCAHVPPRLEAIVHRCLEKDPARRYPTAGDLCRELRFVQSRLTSLSQPPSRRQPVATRPGAHLRKLTTLMTAAPANELGAPFSALEPSLDGLTLSPARATAGSVSPKSGTRYRDALPSWAITTRHSLKPQGSSWKGRVVLCAAIGVVSGYAMARVAQHPAVSPRAALGVVLSD